MLRIPRHYFLSKLCPMMKIMKAMNPSSPMIRTRDVSMTNSFISSPLQVSSISPWARSTRPSSFCTGASKPPASTIADRTAESRPSPSLSVSFVPSLVPRPVAEPASVRFAKIQEPVLDFEPHLGQAPHVIAHFLCPSRRLLRPTRVQHFRRRHIILWWTLF